MTERPVAHYCGVSAKEVSDSLRMAGQFLWDNVSFYAPEIKKTLDSWIDQNPFMKVLAAETSEKLDDVLENTGTKSLLAIFRDVLAFHALMDTGKQISDKDLSPIKIYKKLALWGGLDFEDSGRHWGLREKRLLPAIDGYLTRKCVVVLTDHAEGRNSAAAQRMQRFLYEEGYADEGATGDVEEFGIYLHNPEPADIARKEMIVKFEDYIYTRQHSGPHAAAGFFENLSRDEQIFIKQGLWRILGFDLKEELLLELSPMKSYGLVVDPKAFSEKSDTVSILAAQAKIFEDVVDEIFDGSLKEQWVRVTKPGNISMDGQYRGIRFKTTENLAAQIAQCFGKRTIMDRFGYVVPPAPRVM